MKRLQLLFTLPAYVTKTAGISVEELPAHTFDWSLMSRQAKPQTSEEADAVALVLSQNMDQALARQVLHRR